MDELKNISDKVEKSIPEIEKLSSDLSLVAAQSAQVKLISRTFSGNKGVLDIDGRPLSKYSAEYAKKRLKNGLQIANKDLIFDKNSSAIFNSLDVGTKSGVPAFGFSKEKGAKIAGYQESQNNTKIFQLNKQERDQVITDVMDFVREKLKEIVNKWH